MDGYFLIYAALYRLCIIGAGVAIVYMGYRLFVLGVMPKEGSEIDAQNGEIRLSIKNAAPGTCFAFLGMLLIASMIIFDPPKFDKKDDGGISIRGSEIAGFKEAKTHYANGQYEKALTEYSQILSMSELRLIDTVDVFYGLGQSFEKLKSYQVANTYGRIALQIDSNHQEAKKLVILTTEKLKTNPMEADTK